MPRVDSIGALPRRALAGKLRATANGTTGGLPRILPRRAGKRRFSAAHASKERASPPTAGAAAIGAAVSSALLALFEIGAIVFHIAEQHAGLLPDDANARARAITWMFAALNTVEPSILELGTARLLEGDKPWHAERLPLVEDRVRGRLNQLSVRLGNADWLDGAFRAGDLLMVSVLLRLKSSGMLDEYPNLAAYVARGEARPAYKRAFDAQLAVYTGKPSTG
jgi:hypothetical protein